MSGALALFQVLPASVVLKIPRRLLEEELWRAAYSVVGVEGAMAISTRPTLELGRAFAPEPAMGCQVWPADQQHRPALRRLAVSGKCR